ncbi:MAG: amidohydrolase family protein [Edaphobacter sp.]
MKPKSITGRDPHSGEPLKISIDNGRIQSIDPGPADEHAWLSAGFIDLQVNGYLGSDLNSGEVDPEVVISLTRKMAATGVTTYLPTIVTASEERITAALRMVAEARRASPLVAHAVPFVHVEGPYISPEDGPRGAHEREHVRPASLGEFDRWQAASGNLVGMVTISPHREDALEYISVLAARGIVMAIGHSDATPAQIHAAADAGATLSTHLGNGLGSPLPRHPNLLWAQIAEDRLTACFIADGHHLPADTLKAMLRAKGMDRSVLVSDTVALGGMPVGIYDAGVVGGRVEVTTDGRVMSASGGRFLAGAYCPLMDCIAHVANMKDFSLRDAVRMATENPGRFVGSRGKLRVGADADLVRFHWDSPAAKLQIQTVLARGEEFL